MSTLRPPLPPPLSHEGIAFVAAPSQTSGELSAAEIAAIASALSSALPPGDFHLTEGGTLLYSNSGQLSPWGLAGRLESLRRDER
jgi:hypothetical protein